MVRPPLTIERCLLKMKKRRRNISGFRGGMGALLALSALSSCIDEDLSKCGVDYAAEYVVEQRLEVSLQGEIASELIRPEEQPIGRRLEQALGGVFTDVAHDIDLSFYDGNRLAWHENNVVNAASASVTVYLQRADYRNLALANLAIEPAMALTGADSDLTMTVGYRAEADTVESQSAGLFSARMDMRLEDRSQTFSTRLYMLNCAAALVIDRNGCQPEDIRAYVEGTAAGFGVNDSTYSFGASPIVRTRRITEGGYDCLYAAMLPSADGTRAADGLWRMKVYVQTGGKTTENVITVNDPLRAGCMRIIKVRMKGDGSVEAVTPEVGVSVTLDWKPGGSHDVEI